jgi:hypothetical protein
VRIEDDAVGAGEEARPGGGALEAVVDRHEGPVAFTEAGDGADGVVGFEVEGREDVASNAGKVC